MSKDIKADPRFKSAFEQLQQPGGNPNIPMEVDVITLVCVIANIQVATRHPNNTGPGRIVAERFARQLQTIVAEVCPNLEPILEMGWNPDFDY